MNRDTLEGKIQHFRKVKRDVKNLHNKVEFSNESIISLLDEKNDRIGRYKDDFFR